MEPMHITVSPETLETLWTSLNEAPENISAFSAYCLFKEISDKEWGTLSDIQDILYEVEPRLAKRELGIDTLCQLFSINIETAFEKPSSKSNSTGGYPSVRSFDIARLLIILERIGFNTDASLLVEKILPQLKIKHKTLLSISELDVFWFEKHRHKKGEVILTALSKEEKWLEKSYNNIKLKTDKGYKVEAKINSESKPVHLKIIAPKYRHPRIPIKVVCPECNYEWMKGDPDSSECHRREHKKRLKYFSPQPLLKLLEIKKNDKDFELVTAHSPGWKHKEIYYRALAFKREFKYDFVQWKSPKGDNDPNAHGFLLSDDNGAVIGACAFRQRTTSDDKKLWVLDWIWICPSERRKGHLAKRWKLFRERFGDFLITPPVSKEMLSFLDKRGEKPY